MCVLVLYLCLTYLDVDVGHVVGRDEPAHDNRVAQRRPGVSDHFQPLVRSHLQDLKTIQSFMQSRQTKYANFGKILQKCGTAHIFWNESGVENGADRVLPERHPLLVGPPDQVDGEVPRLLESV